MPPPQHVREKKTLFHTFFLSDQLIHNVAQVGNGEEKDCKAEKYH